MEPKRTFSELEWNLTPEALRHYILHLERTLSDMASRLASQCPGDLPPSLLYQHHAGPILDLTDKIRSPL